MAMNAEFLHKFPSSTYRWGVNFDVKVFNNIYMNVAILQYKTDIAYTCCKQLTSTVLSIYPSPFWGIHEKSRNVSFRKFWNCRRHGLAKIQVMIRCFSLTLCHSLGLLQCFYHRNGHLLGGVAHQSLWGGYECFAGGQNVVLYMILFQNIFK